jgi:hypothetical protein
MKYQLIEPSAHAPWHASMRNLVGTNDIMGDLVLDLLTGSLTPTTYGAGMRRFIIFFATKRASPRYMLPRPTYYASQHGSPEEELSRRASSNPTSQRSSMSSEITLRSWWR